MKKAIDSIAKYFGGVWSELLKVSWPIKKGKNLSFYDKYGELVESVVAVIITVTIFTLFIAGVDFLVSQVIDTLIS